MQIKMNKEVNETYYECWGCKTRFEDKIDAFDCTLTQTCRELKIIRLLKDIKHFLRYK